MTGSTTTTTTTMIDWADHLIIGDSTSIVDGAATNSSSYNTFESSSSMFDSTYTYSNGKLSCMKEFFTLHTIFNYLIFLSGLICLVSRLLSASTIHKYKLENVHSWSGRIYIISMLWSTATSLVINNEGLPIAVITTFGGVMGGLTFGWISILIYQQKLTNQATQIVQEKIIHKTTTKYTLMMMKKERMMMKKKKTGDDDIDVDEDDDSSFDVVIVDDKDKNENNLNLKLNLNEMINGAKADIIYQKTFVQRFFSFKALHGVLFFVSWMQITGRLIFSSHLLDNTFSCRSYPVYKPLPKDTLYVPEYVSESYDEHDNNDQNKLLLYLMPIHDPEWERKPWSNGPIKWGLMMICIAAMEAIIVGAIITYYHMPTRRKGSKTSNLSSASSTGSSSTSSTTSSSSSSSSTPSSSKRSSSSSSPTKGSRRSQSRRIISTRNINDNSGSGSGNCSSSMSIYDAVASI